MRLLLEMSHYRYSSNFFRVSKFNNHISDKHEQRQPEPSDTGDTVCDISNLAGVLSLTRNRKCNPQLQNKNCSDLLVRNFARSLEGIGVYLDLTDFEGYDLICAWVVFYFMTRCAICLWLIVTDMRRTKSIRVRNKALKIVHLNKYWPESNFVKDASNDP